MNPQYLSNTINIKFTLLKPLKRQSDSRLPRPSRLIHCYKKVSGILLVSAAIFIGMLFGTQAKAADVTSRGTTSAEPPIFAKVGKKTITMQDYDTAFAATARAKFYHGKPPDAEIATLQREVGEKLITEILLLREAKLRKIKPDEKIITQQLEKLELRYQNDEEWKKVRTEELPKIKRQMEDKSLLSQLEKRVRNVPEPNEKQLREFYSEHIDKFTAPEQQRVSVILLRVDPSSPNEVWENTLDESKKLFTRLQDGEDFAELAREYSGDSSAEQGGDMGYLHKGMLSEAGQEQVAKLKPGEISEPTVMMEGVAIFRLTDRQPPKINKFEDVQERVRGLLLIDQANQAWESLKARLRKETPVEVNETHYLPLPTNVDQPVEAK